MTRQESGRGRKMKPGRITFVGSGPGDPGLLTARAHSVLVNAALVFTDPDVPEAVLSLVGAHLPPPSGPEPAEPADAADEQAGSTIPGGPDIRPALGDPAEVAKVLAGEAKHGVDVVRLVAGDPLSVDAVIAEVNALAKSHANFEIVPGLPNTTAVPTYAGLPLGSTHTVADVRDPNVDWAALAAAPGPLILHATASHLPDAARTLIEYGLAETTPAVVTANGTTCQQRSVESTLSGLLDKAALTAPDATGAPAAPLAGPLVVTLGRTVTNRARLNWWESRALYGWTVLVPRTKDQAGEMSDKLVGHGALPIEVPTIAVEPPRSPAQMERAVKGLVDGRFQWVVFTSTNAVRAVWEKFNEFGLDARAFSGVKIACVGQATAERVRAFGINPELVPTGEQSSLGLLDEFPPYDDIFDPVNRVLLPRADIATETLAEGLRERGWEIEDVTAYRTVRAAPPPASTREMIKTGGFDAVCFTSSSTVRNLVGIAGKPHARTIVACIGPKTAETAAEFGLRVDVQPEVAAVGPLVEALAEHAARLRAEGALPPPRKKSRRR
ncbi:bifunctional uroporphyrinogen-III C-methyltransferase/uroporphyrinogen-III synthase [Mycolicibacterium monacense]|uniref:Bifunctional uroporphyrinogen-III C-methyltransferase/uroporphyrinogen-III synthase n=3 Tax=Mycobacteriaceae TaxID=1762 RepID=A0AAD1J269_MYCMB|nr:bifunctional uroporphyrinogen-III C-methyltransferase/uroporphyrinogen-III synthase [Mycolicibacterium monacense]MDA4100227.1 uroporphyrin-III C-methyltransferase [Mycolicibacterium monacense DSM 44395]OBB76007.1 bifunctional uroporphyrinogen-III C-methyltransferase/uroporphyrinogen-III synthase [Mycolicibacterium monacense]OBF48642.1 bifunctional uroporphyrinogen-III C-methyltransferase/uroporphyrinogen-III synthase [Mycolicibacterium monacense]ORB22367.1 bifunctional uroporphyrinogen-III C